MILDRATLTVEESLHLKQGGKGSGRDSSDEDLRVKPKKRRLAHGSFVFVSLRSNAVARPRTSRYMNLLTCQITPLANLFDEHTCPSTSLLY